MEFSIEQLNEMLSKVDFNPCEEPDNAKERKDGHQGVVNAEYGVQGESNIFYDIYETPNKEYFLRATVETDSYGDSEKVIKLDIVKAAPKTITIYEIEE